MEQGLYANVVMIPWKDKENEKKKENSNNITSKDSPEDKGAGLVLIMSGYQKISWHLNHVSF